MKGAYYNDNNLAAAAVLKQQISNGVIAPGDVDTRSIKDVNPDDLAGYTQCHFFAGGGLWSVAARLAGWPDHAPLWTGSCPCQPFSAAGKGRGTDDPRHLWPDFHRLIRAQRPPVVMGEQVARAAGYGWFDGVRADLEREGYAGRATDFPACSIDAPHQRNRLYWIAVEYAEGFGRGEGGPEYELRSGWPTPTGSDACRSLDHSFGAGLEGHTGDGDVHANPDRGGRTGRAEDAKRFTFERAPSQRSLLRNGTHWSDAEWINCHDEKARRAKPGIRFLVDGLPGRVDLWRVAGNAIVPEAAAEVIAAFIDAYGLPIEQRAAA